TPSITTITPAAGTLEGGTTITIVGTGFDLYTTVTVGNRTCTDVQVASSTSLTCVTPEAAATGAVDVVVTNHLFVPLSSASDTEPNGYTYNSSSLTPVVSSITPAEGPVAGGTVVVIGGSNFNLGSQIAIGGQTCGSLVHLSTTSISCVAP